MAIGEKGEKEDGRMPLNESRGNMYQECACGCGTRIPMFGTDGRSRSFLIGHSRKGKVMPFADRFWNKVNKTSHTDCWEWLAYKNNKGYGRIKQPGRNGLLQYAHRIAWLLTYGPIPEGVEVCHHCDNPACVNPSHLFLGSHLDNMQDALSKDRLRSKLNQLLVTAIRRRYKDGALQQELADEYGITQGQTSRVVRHESW